MSIQGLRFCSPVRFEVGELVGFEIASDWQIRAERKVFKQAQKLLVRSVLKHFSTSLRSANDGKSFGATFEFAPNV